ncbi:MAG: Gfo/Idh/MocA family protein [Planctomycetota bacterium]
MRQLNVGVIGLGMGEAHLKGYEACSDASVVGVCDIDEGRLDEILEGRDGIAGYEDYTDLLDRDDLDAVSIALPNYLHAPVTREALESGKHVLCEKPMAMNADEAQEMKRTADDAGLALMLHFNMRFMTTAATVRPLIESGQLGHIYHATTTYTRQDGYPNPGTWFGIREKSGGGPMIDLGVHRLDLTLWLMGYPKPTSVLGNTYDLLAREQLEDVDFDCEDFSAAMIRFDNGSTLYVTASWDAHQREQTEQTMQLYGTRGSVFEEGGDVTYCTTEDGDPTNKNLEQLEADESPQAHFVRSIMNGEKPGPSADHGVIVMQILDAIYESARTGQPVEIQ